MSMVSSRATAGELDADLVVDAMGRRSPLLGWLSDQGGQPPELVSEDAGFVYLTRYFRGPELPVMFGPPVTDIGTISLLTLPGDNDTWSVTIFGSSADHGVASASEIPSGSAASSRPARSRPTGCRASRSRDVFAMAGVLDRYRRFVVDGRPGRDGRRRGRRRVGVHEPVAGRGISLGLVHAQQLRPWSPPRPRRLRRLRRGLAPGERAGGRPRSSGHQIDADRRAAGRDRGAPDGSRAARTRPDGPGAAGRHAS